MPQPQIEVLITDILNFSSKLTWKTRKASTALSSARFAMWTALSRISNPKLIAATR